MPNPKIDGDYQGVIRLARDHLLGTIMYFPVERLESGANMRRPGFGGVARWKATFEGVGFNLNGEEGHSIRAYPLEKDLDKWKELFRSKQETEGDDKAKLLKEDLPPEMAALTLKIIDGQHRSVALQQTLQECRDAKMSEEDMAKYRYVRVLLYGPAILPHAISLSKAANEVTPYTLQLSLMCVFALQLFVLSVSTINPYIVHTMFSTTH